MKERIHIGIIGAGIAGCSAALLSHDIFPGAKITVLEASPRAGGRIRSLDVAGQAIEFGGSFMHSSNRLGLDLVHRLRLSRMPLQLTGRSRASLGIWDGRQFVMRLSAERPIASVRALTQYGRTPLRVFQLARRVLWRWGTVYEVLKQGRSFGSCLDLLRSCDLASIAQMQFVALLAREKLSARFAADVVSSIVRGIFMHDLEINGLAGAVALIAAGAGGGRQWSVEGGNARLCEAALVASGAAVDFGTEVARVEATPSRKVVVVDSRAGRHEFDAILSAIPKSLTQAPSELHWQPSSNARRLRSTSVAVVTGSLAPQYFGAENGGVPSLVLSPSASSSRFTTLRRVGATVSGDSIYKVQSDHPIESEIKAMFATAREASFSDWTECPDLSASSDDRPFRLAPGIYDASAMEQVLSTIESQLIGARNAVHLMAKDLSATK